MNRKGMSPRGDGLLPSQRLLPRLRRRQIEYGAVFAATHGFQIKAEFSPYFLQLCQVPIAYNETFPIRCVD